jgi:hypothetical protein
MTNDEYIKLFYDNLDNLTHSQVILPDGKNFSIVHNLPDTFGLRIEDAIENWIVRAENFTAESLCQYIMSKGDPAIVAVPEQIYQDFLNQ